MIYCRYCKRPLENPIDIHNEYHVYCNKEMEDYQSTLFEKKTSLHQVLKYNISYYFTNNDLFDPEYRKILPYLLHLTDIVSKEAFRYFQEDGQIILLYKSNDLSLPDFFTSVESLRTIFLDVDVYSSFNFDDKISYRILRKICQVTYHIGTMQEDGFSYKPAERLTQEFINKLAELEPKNIEVRNISHSITDFFTYEEALDDENISYYRKLLESFPTLENLEFFYMPPIGVLKYKLHLKSLTLSGGSFVNPNDFCYLNELIFFQIDFYNDERNPYDLNDILEKMINLQYLLIASSPLHSIPESIRNLKDLQILVLFDCQINKIPNWIVELENLKILSLFKNEIDNYPVFLKELKNLLGLDLGGNPYFVGIDEDIQGLSDANFFINYE